MAEPLPGWQRAFLVQHQLPPAYLDSALKWFAPVGELLAEHQVGASGALLVGVNGCQGSGKSTLCDFLCHWLGAEHGLRAVALSLDDFYLTRAERRELAASTHPLLATRGVPGTHDMGLLLETVDALTAGESVQVPRFDKSVDDRMPASSLPTVEGPLDLVLLEGWCMGATAQADAALQAPLNRLETEEDADGRWRRFVNDALASAFPPLYERVDEWIMLQAPSFDCVFSWRLEQEEKLRSSSDGKAIMSEAQVARFIQFYQRITEQCLRDLPRRVNHLFRLDGRRHVESYLAAPGKRL